MLARRGWLAVWILLAGIVLAACGAAPTPPLVASYPKTGPGQSAGFVPDGSWPVRSVHLVLEVEYPDRAADEAVDLAREAGGYETARDFWWIGGRRAVTQQFRVPIPHSEEFRWRLHGLGEVKDEYFLGGSDILYDGDWAGFSVKYLPAPPATEWGPSVARFVDICCAGIRQLFEVCLQVTMSFAVAILILAPLGLMMLGAVTLCRWLFRK